ncbi:hypothetical protein IVG45_06420 [Methylomonas sp. LL1]|uniref:hypothetical protein n=1 Tax=Methylomonas sp. LL1 TaxID=2785785 RepID=UPI0018C3E388|nr:hypothetical protein [Methylomonas sp. LL1]QPK64587.1 hypothetical protein IVG45_06420 [Methylomonas sp. LL1]
MAKPATIRRIALLIILMALAESAPAELVVIVNAGREIESISKQEVVNIFMGRYRKLADGGSVQPIDVKGDSPERRDFYQKLLDKSLAEINAYWARLVFSGRTSPPVSLDSQDDVLDKIARDQTVIGYVDSAHLDGRVKVVYRLAN